MPRYEYQQRVPELRTHLLVRTEHDVSFAGVRAARNPHRTPGELRRAQCLPGFLDVRRQCDVELDIASDVDTRHRRTDRREPLRVDAGLCSDRDVAQCVAEQGPEAAMSP